MPGSEGRRGRCGMKQLVTRAIILSRTDYGEADRILTVLTPEYGKLRLMAKGVRRVKSKLAGGIELFSVSEITFIRGKSELGTLASTRLISHYGHIVQDLQRTMTGYDLIKQLHKLTEDEAEADYFDLLHRAFEALDDADIPLPVITFWFAAQVLRFGGHTPNLRTDVSGAKLEAGVLYDFNFENMSFMTAPEGLGRYNADHIKLLRIVFGEHTPKTISQVQGTAPLVVLLGSLVDAMRRNVA
ncbi:MAG TPA: DNA repair protein RecO [Candidatus Saccharimonadales bacterium]|nr:DNA repair protein RecO [Candidatus Saccharimonadales bacterium]